MAVTTDYTGRTVDLLIFDGVKATGMQRVNLEIGDTPKVCTGIQKVAQLFTIQLLTEKNSDLVGLGGTSFLTAVRRGNIKNDGDIEFYFNLAVSEIMEYLNKNEGADVPDDENLVVAELLSFTIIPGYLTLSVRLETLAGDTRDVILPVSVVIK